MFLPDFLWNREFQKNKRLRYQKIQKATKIVKKYYENQIEDLSGKKEDLQATLENVNSSEYIEKVAREKLGMYYPYESVFIDISK